MVADKCGRDGEESAREKAAERAARMLLLRARQSAAREEKGMIRAMLLPHMRAALARGSAQAITRALFECGAAR